MRSLLLSLGLVFSAAAASPDAPAKPASAVPPGKTPNLGATEGTLAWEESPEVQKEKATAAWAEAQAMIPKLQIGRDRNGTFVAKLGLLDEWTLWADTFEFHLTPDQCRDLYTRTCERMEQLWPGKVQGWIIYDLFTYETRHAIIELPDTNGFQRVRRLIVTFGEGNDSRSYSFRTETTEKPFDGKGTALKPLTSWKLDAKVKEGE